ncbi:unnamed protein product [Trichobilharzia regenti]|nr:unnamed protein product [Trichobilharzia regenti]
MSKSCFNITNLYTTKNNEACLSVSRVNAVNRLRQMNWITDEILSMHKTPLQLLKELIRVQRSKLQQQSDEFYLSEIPSNDEAVQSELAKFHERLSQLTQNNIDSIKQFNETTTIEIYNDLTDTWSTVKSNQMNLIIIRYDEYNTGEAIHPTDNNISRNKHQILLNILNKIRKHE